MDPYQPPDDRDFDNPYAPPQSAFVPEAMPDIQAGTPFTVADVFNWSWAIFKEKMWLCMGIFWLTFVTNLAISVGLGLLAQGIAAAANDVLLSRIMDVTAQIVSLVIGTWLGIGQGRAFLKIARGETAGIGEIFLGGRYLITMILGAIVFIVALMTPILLAVALITFGMLAAGSQSAVGIILFLAGSSLAAVYVVYVTARLSLFYYLIIDRNAGPIDSLRQSWNLCRERAGMILMVIFLNFAVVAAGLLAFCVGLLFAVPLANMLFPVTYLALTGTRTSTPGKPEFIWEDDL